jgi:peptidoglycan/LPS O-acetylase OafA/YrhL
MRIRALDSLRGVAALTVVFHHTLVILPENLRNENLRLLELETWGRPWTWLRCSPLWPFVAGRPAVLLFFVLSGLVLALPFVGGTQPSYGRYLVKRFFRLYPPLAVAVLLAAGLCAVIAPHPIGSLSRWFNEDSWSIPPSTALVLDHLFLRGQKFTLDNAIWSLGPEVRISLIFPLLVFFARTGAIASLVAATALYAVAVILASLFPGPGPVADIITTIKFAIFFVMGIAIAFHLRQVTDWAGRLRTRTRVALWGGSLAMMMLPDHSPWADLASGIGAAGIIVLALTSEGADRLLGRRSVEWLGRISYSLYLVHLLAILSMVHLFYGRMPVPVILGAAILVSLAAAHVMHHCVEVPAMALGRYLISAGAEVPRPMRARVGVSVD